MKGYKKYTHSGIDWIGNIPEHWKIKRIKYVFKPIIQKSIDGSEELLSVSETKGVIPRREIRDEDKELTRSETLEGYLIVKKGDLVNNIMLMWKRGLGISNYDGIVSPSYSVFRILNTDNPKYWNYLLRTDLYVTEFRKNSTGIIDSRLRLYDDSFGNIYSILPPISEQNQIVNFLENKTEIIDKLISTKERKIELLKEQRTSLINQVITKGLNPNIKMKKSGIEWIGEIPESWNVVQLRHLTRKVGSGVTPKGGSETYVEEGIIFIRSQNVHFDGLRLEDVVKISSEVNESMSSSKVKYGDVLLNITGGSIGRCCIVNTNVEMNVNQHVCIIRLNGKLLPTYLNYYLQSTIGQNLVEYNISGGNREGLTFESIKCFRIILPPLNEQKFILDYLNKRTIEIDELISFEGRKITLLKEYRQSLISEVITGKIDVRTT